MMGREGPQSLEEIIRPLTERIRALEARERSNWTGGVQSLLFANLPAAGQTGRLLFVTDGRKTGEGAGAGTGVLAYDDGVAWRRVDDGTSVAA